MVFRVNLYVKGLKTGTFMEHDQVGPYFCLDRREGLVPGYWGEISQVKAETINPTEIILFARPVVYTYVYDLPVPQSVTVLKSFFVFLPLGRPLQSRWGHWVPLTDGRNVGRQLLLINRLWENPKGSPFRSWD